MERLYRVRSGRDVFHATERDGELRRLVTSDEGVFGRYSVGEPITGERCLFFSNPLRLFRVSLRQFWCRIRSY